MSKQLDNIGDELYSYRHSSKATHGTKEAAEEAAEGEEEEVSWAPGNTIQNG
jgi:hypothetical protein